jgi:hypothetical protein
MGIHYPVTQATVLRGSGGAYSERPFWVIRDEACTAWDRAAPKPDIARQARDPSTAEAILL